MNFVSIPKKGFLSFCVEPARMAWRHQSAGMMLRKLHRTALALNFLLALLLVPKTCNGLPGSKKEKGAPCGASPVIVEVLPNVFPVPVPFLCLGFNGIGLVDQRAHWTGGLLETFHHPVVLCAIYSSQLWFYVMCTCLSVCIGAVCICSQLLGVLARSGCWVFTFHVLLVSVSWFVSACQAGDVLPFLPSEMANASIGFQNAFILMSFFGVNRLSLFRIGAPRKHPHSF